MNFATTSVVKAYGCIALDSFEIVGRRLAGLAIGDHVEFNLLAFIEAAHPRTLDRADMNEHVRAAVIRLDETETLLAVEPLHGSL